MSWGVISRMGYVAMQTTDLDRSVEHAEEILGLREIGRNGRSISLASATTGRELTYIESSQNGVDRIGLVAANATALGILYERVIDAGFAVLTKEGARSDAEGGFSFVGPEDFVFDIYLEPRTAVLARAPHSPERFGHINLHPVDLSKMLDFFVDILEFRISDVIGDDFAYFLRCNAEHHGVALIKGNGWLHHHAWQVQSIAELGQLGDRLHRRGERLLMGPVRHGAGHNMAAYYVEPNGAVVELYTDMEMIYDDDRPPIVWARDDLSWATRWSVYDFTEFRSHGLFPTRESLR